MFKTLEQVALVFIVIWRYFQHYHNISLTMHTAQINSLVVEAKSDTFRKIDIIQQY
jgi:hypothetical protein